MKGLWSVMHRIGEPAIALPKVSFCAMIFPVLQSLLTILSIFLSKEILNAIQGGNLSIAEYYIPYCILILGIFCIIRIISKNRGFAELRPLGGSYLSKDVLRKFLLLDHSSTEKLGTGKAIAILEKAIWAQMDILTSLLIKFFGQFLITTIFAILLSFSISWFYGSVILVIAMTTVVIHIFVQNKGNTYRRERNDRYTEYMRDFVRIIMAKFEVLQSQKINFELEKIADHFMSWVFLNYKTETMRLYGDLYAKIMLDGTKILAIVAVVYGFFGFHLAVGDFLALMAIIVLLEQQSNDISRFYIDATRQFVSVEKMRQLLDETPLLQGYHEGEIASYHGGEIRFDNISFAYDGSHQVLNDFSVGFKGQSITALVGASGSGKSTIAKLIAGYLKPDHGEIMIEHQKLSKLSLESYYRTIGYLTQEPNVFDGSFLDNLLYGVDDTFNLEKDREILDDALVKACCDFVATLPNGLDTQIGERGVRLSGGQKQRLAIAKLFLRNPKIIILDEPTSALDSVSEHAITQALHRLFAGRTVIIIAHRLQTVKYADTIFVIEQGKVVEIGNHDSLSQAGGSYQTMLELQSGFVS